MLFVDFSKLLKVSVSTQANVGSIGYINTENLNQRQIDELTGCPGNTPLSQLSQDIQVAIISQAIKSGALAIEVSVTRDITF